MLLLFLLLLVVWDDLGRESQRSEIRVDFIVPRRLSVSVMQFGRPGAARAACCARVDVMLGDVAQHLEQLPDFGDSFSLGLGGRGCRFGSRYRRYKCVKSGKVGSIPCLNDLAEEDDERDEWRE